MTENHKVLSGWGQYPKYLSQIEEPLEDELYEEILHADQWIPRGLGRSYGDSAVAKQVILTTHLNHILSFDQHSGVLHCQSGVSLREIIERILPMGWALPVTPGTAWVTVGGAIASDVHGKNHHQAGCLSQHVLAIELLTPRGEKIICSAVQNAQIFFATCGGMGLTGLIVSAKLQLIPVTSSLIQQRCIKTNSLEKTIEVLAQNNHSTYSVAWIDALVRGDKLGRGHVYLGEHVQVGTLDLKERFHPKRLPLKFFSPLMHPLVLKTFNASYFHQQRTDVKESILNWQAYFYPLDKVYDWHQFYGEKGFTQYQFVVPFSASHQVKNILLKVQKSGLASALSVIKLCGAANKNYLSFPIAGVSVALDFKITPHLFKLLDYLDGMVIESGGRVYLTKDCRLSAENFRVMYPAYEAFCTVRAQVDPSHKIYSLQSKRLKL